MKLSELKEILEATGYPVAYSHFNREVKPPFICYVIPYSPNFIADDMVYHKINDVDIELYTDLKNEETEAALEAVLDANHIPYFSDETFIESEKLFQKTYEVRLF